MTEILTLKRKTATPGTYTIKIIDGKITRVAKQDVVVAKQDVVVAKQEPTGATPQPATKIPTRDVVRWMIATYPLCFFKDDRKPLKIGINEDLILAAKGIYGRGKIKNALTQYIHSLKYQQAMYDKKERVDLEGKATGIVTEQQRSGARFNLKKYKKAAGKI